MRTPHLSRRLRRLVALSTLALLAVLTGLLAPVAAAHERESATIHVANITAHDNGLNDAGFRGSFSMPTKVPTGLVEFHFVNAGSTFHMAQFARLNPGVSESQFLQTFTPLVTSRDPKVVVAALKAVLKIASPQGGPNSIFPGGVQDVIERLLPGHYVAFCLDSTDNGTPHFLLGMHRSFWVSDDARAPVDRDEALSGGSPRADGTVIEFDHQINVPHDITESERLLLKVKVFDQIHEFALLRVPAGTTKSALLACLAGPPSGCKLDFTQIMDSGGVGPILPGATQWVELHLKPGTYAALCFVPDIVTGMPHAFMGMITVFTVTK